MKQEGMALHLAGRWLPVLSFCCAVLVMASTAPAVIIDFTGGTAYLLGGGTVVTNNTVNAATVRPGATDYYIEGGFKLDFIGSGGIIGDYYVSQGQIPNDVIHGHWATGGLNALTEIKVTKVGGGTFDLNYFELTSNTDTGGAAASGAEQAYITANYAGVLNATSILLPSDDWGWTGPNPQIFLPATYDNISSFSFTAANTIDCYGMDEFFIDEPAPPVIPEPMTMLAMGLGITGLGGYIRKRRMA